MSVKRMEMEGSLERLMYLINKLHIMTPSFGHVHSDGEILYRRGRYVFGKRQFENYLARMIKIQGRYHNGN